MKDPLLDIQDLCLDIAARTCDTAVLAKIEDIRGWCGFVLETIECAARVLNEEAKKELDAVKED